MKVPEPKTNFVITSTNPDTKSVGFTLDPKMVKGLCNAVKNFGTMKEISGVNSWIIYFDQRYDFKECLDFLKAFAENAKSEEQAEQEHYFKVELVEDGRVYFATDPITYNRLVSDVSAVFYKREWDGSDKYMAHMGNPSLESGMSRVAHLIGYGIILTFDNSCYRILS